MKRNGLRKPMTLRFLPPVSLRLNYAAFEKEDQIRRRMLYALKYFKERTKENLSGVTPYECYADAKKHLNQND